MKVIWISGVGSSGKTTACISLIDDLKNQGYRYRDVVISKKEYEDIVKTKFPGESVLVKSIRKREKNPIAFLESDGLNYLISSSGDDKNSIDEHAVVLEYMQKENKIDWFIFVSRSDVGSQAIYKKAKKLAKKCDQNFSELKTEQVKLDKNDQNRLFFNKLKDMIKRRTKGTK